MDRKYIEEQIEKDRRCIEANDLAIRSKQAQIETLSSRLLEVQEFVRLHEGFNRDYEEDIREWEEKLEQLGVGEHWESRGLKE